MKDTGKWLLNSKQFQEWRASSASEILWLHGIRKLRLFHLLHASKRPLTYRLAGGGKTKLTWVSSRFFLLLIFLFT